MKRGRLLVCTDKEMATGLASWWRHREHRRVRVYRREVSAEGLSAPVWLVVIHERAP